MAFRVAQSYNIIITSICRLLDTESEFLLANVIHVTHILYCDWVV